MSPMIFEKSLSMAQNVHIQNGKHIDGHMIVVVDLARNEWDWNRLGEPPRIIRHITCGIARHSAGWAAKCTTCRLITGIFYVSYSTCCPKPAPTDSAVCSSGASGLTF